MAPDGTDGARGTDGTDATAGYRGQRLGLPEHGPGSLASFGRRLAAVVLDWVAATALVAVLTRGHLTYGTPTFSLVVLGVFGLEVLLLTWRAGGSLGQLALHMQVSAFGSGRVPFDRALLRTVLLCLAVPPLIWDRDGRGLHDRAALTAVLNTV